MFRNRPVPLALVGLFVWVTACTSYKQIQPADVADYGKVRVTFADGERVVLEDVTVEGDSIHYWQEVEQSVSLQQFTRRLHEVMSYDEKRRVVEMMWRIALADRRLDKYEDYMVGKIAELLYISRGDVLRERNRVQESNTPESGAY